MNNDKKDSKITMAYLLNRAKELNEHVYIAFRSGHIMDGFVHNIFLDEISVVHLESTEQNRPSLVRDELHDFILLDEIVHIAFAVDEGLLDDLTAIHEGVKNIGDDSSVSSVSKSEEEKMKKKYDEAMQVPKSKRTIQHTSAIGNWRDYWEGTLKKLSSTK